MASKFVANPLNFKLAKEETQPAIMKIANKVVKTAARLAPKETGALSKSGKVTALSKGGARIQFTVRYAGFVEFGTVYQEPQPYLRPALDTVGFELR